MSLIAAQILLRILIKRPLASKRTKIIGLSLVFRCASSCCGINIHVANGIMYGCRHVYSFRKNNQTNRLLRPERYYADQQMQLCLFLDFMAHLFPVYHATLEIPNVGISE